MIKNICIFLIFVFTSPVFSQEGSISENEIVYFAAKIEKAEVNLLFKISNPLNLNRITVESRKAAEQEFKKLTDIQFNNFRKKEESDSITIYNYNYSDNVNENGVYFYRISLIDNANKLVASEQIKLGISEINEFVLHQNNPNPFNPATTIVYELLVPSSVKLQVYTLTGKQIDELVNANQGPGTYTVEFNADNYGELSSGIYFYKLTTNYSSDIKKMILTK